MARRISSSLLLVLSLLFGLWTTAAHDPDHDSASHGDHCAVCVVAHTLGNGLSAYTPGLILATHRAGRAERRPVLSPRNARLAPHARGPPTFFA